MTLRYPRPARDEDEAYELMRQREVDDETAAEARITRVEVYSKPDERGRVHHARFWMTDYVPGHPDGENKLREVGQHFFSELPRKFQ